MATLCLLGGCFLSRGSEDTGSGEDTGVRDGGLPDGLVCAQYGPYRSCEGECEALCPTLYSDVHCDDRVGICYANFASGQSDSCSYSSSGGFRYCTFGDRVCVIPRDAPDTGGSCREFSLCAPAHAAGANAVCTYSDGSTFVNGPPEEACPPGPDGRWCGPTCGSDACPFGGGFFSGPQACVGVSETRGVGICVLDEGDPYGPDNAALFMEGRLEDTHLILVYVEEGALRPTGYLMHEDGCRAYRDRYPGQIACANPALGWEDVDGR